MRETKHTNDRSEVTNGLRCSEGARTFSPSLLPRNLKAEEAQVLARLAVLQVGLREAYSRPRRWGSVAIQRDKVESRKSARIEGAAGSRGQSGGSWAKRRVRNTVGEGIRRTRKRSDDDACSRVSVGNTNQKRLLSGSEVASGISEPSTEHGTRG